MKPKLLSEAQVSKQVVDWMAARGYTAERMNVGVANYGARGRVSYGTKGQTDFIFTHPRFPACYVEIKKDGYTPVEVMRISPDRVNYVVDKSLQRELEQAQYRAGRRALGFRAFWVNSLAMLEKEML